MLLHLLLLLRQLGLICNSLLYATSLVEGAPHPLPLLINYHQQTCFCKCGSNCVRNCVRNGVRNCGSNCVCAWGPLPLLSATAASQSGGLHLWWDYCDWTAFTITPAIGCGLYSHAFGLVDADSISFRLRATVRVILCLCLPTMNDCGPSQPGPPFRCSDPASLADLALLRGGILVAVRLAATAASLRPLAMKVLVVADEVYGRFGRFGDGSQHNLGLLGLLPCHRSQSQLRRFAAQGKGALGARLGCCCDVCALEPT